MKKSIVFSMAFLSCATVAFSQTLDGGSNHSLLICKGDGEGAGGLQSWGFNYHGQLGQGVVGTNDPLPQTVNGISDLTAVSGGAMHSILLKSNGQLVVMGENSYGQLGLGDTTDVETPTDIPGLTGFTAISAGWEHSLALKNDGTVWAWGRNSNGQLGLGDTVYRSTPTQIPGLSGITAISAGRNHSLAVGANGTVWAWGWNPLGQLGDNTTTDSYEPLQVPGLTGFVAVAGGDWHSVALKGDGTVWAWGTNTNGELGQGNWTAAPITTPTQVPGLSDITAISTGRFHNVALTASGTMYSWGSNAYGEIGDGTTDDALSPVVLVGYTDIAEVSAGGEFTLFMRTDGTVWGIGLNGNGQLGNGTMWNQFTDPQPVTGPCSANQTNGIAEGTVNISVYPNPANDVVTIAANGLTIRNVSLLTTDGRLCTCDYDAVSQTVDVKALASGAYFLLVETTNGAAMQQIVKE